MNRQFFTSGLFALLIFSATAFRTNTAPPADTTTANAAMLKAAESFLQTLTAAQKTKAALPFEGEARLTWTNVPSYRLKRAGVPFEELNAEQKKAVHELIRTALSAQGYLKASRVIWMDEFYRNMLKESGVENFGSYGHGYYWASVFGTPSADKPWGWRVEGHHLSLNFTVTPGGISSTPMFMGVNPAEIQEGPYAGARVMSDEMDVAWALMNSMNEQQRKKAVYTDKMPDDILTRTGEEPHLKTYSGVPASEMNAPQRELLTNLVEAYVNNLRKDLAERQMGKIKKAGFNKLHFAWAGGAKPGEAIYYRVHGPSFIIELDNRSYEPNHIHSVWRDLNSDFGGDYLSRK